MDEIQAIAADIMAAAKSAHPRPPFVVTDEQTPDDLAIRRVDGRCSAGCAHGWRFVEVDGYVRTEACPECHRVRTLADRFNAAGFPAWVHRVRREWREAVSPYAGARELATRLIAGRDIGRTYHGGTGGGKSWRAAAVALECIDAGASVKWLNWPRFMGGLKDRISSRESIGDVIARPILASVLIVDELGLEDRGTQFGAEVGERLIGQRAEAQRPMIVTTNKSPDVLRDYLGDRVWSRLAPYRVTEVTGRDLRGAA